MSKKEILDNEIKLSKELHDSIKSLLQMLDDNGWELNDDGDIVFKGTSELVWEKYNGFKESK